jgi:anthranilate/para-aminobenzoate synthase component II
MSDVSKVLTLGYLGMGTGATEPFDVIFGHSELVTAAEIKAGLDLDALVIWGGEDISPSLYNEKPAKQCGAGPLPSRRDVAERDACRACIERGIPIIGVCRGAQLLCALAGGRLLQHVEGHAGRSHSMMTCDNMNIITNSVHHQMMYPFEIEHKMIAWAHPKISHVHIDQYGSNDPRMANKVEPEIVWFPKIKGLAIQGHPEFIAKPDESPFVQYCLDLIDEYILGVEQ